MKIKYVQDTDTLQIEFWPAEVHEARRTDENTRLEMDAAGRLFSITIDHASDRIDLPSLRKVSNSAHGILNLAPQEQTWLEEFRHHLKERFPGLLEDILIYGSYAQGISDPEIELKMVVLITEGDWKEKEEVSYLGYDLDTEFVVCPSISVYTMSEWAEYRRIGAPTYKTVANDGISVA